MMFQRILVPLDGSARAERALGIAARLARTTQGILILVRVVNHFVLMHYSQEEKNKQPIPHTRSKGNNRSRKISSTTDGFSSKQPLSTYIDEELEEEGVSTISKAEEYLQAIANSAELIGIGVETAILSGPIASTLLSAIISFHADLIVLCSHGHSGVTSKLLGSVAEKLVCRSPIPILLLREGNLLPQQSCRILVALDGSPYANKILLPATQLATALATPGHSTLHLTRVVSPPTPAQNQYISDPRTTSREHAQQLLVNLTEALCQGLIIPEFAQEQIDVTWSVIENEQIAQTLVRVADNQNSIEDPDALGGYDIIALTIHDLESFQRLTFSSISAQVMSLTHKPILFVQTTVSPQRYKPINSF
jgi:nucleotide-binding universal stress UspA family protein